MEDVENNPEGKAPELPKPYIPPPVLPQPSPPPPLPSDRTGSVAPLPTSVAVDVRIRSDGTPGDGVATGGIAPFNTRAVAAIIDFLVAGGVGIVASWLLPGFADRVAWMLGAAYLITRDSLPFLEGRSIGKKAMKLKAVTGDGELLTANWQAALARNAVLIIPVFPIIELFVLLNRENGSDRGRRLGDEWGKTKVVIDTKSSVEEMPE